MMRSLKSELPHPTNVPSVKKSCIVALLLCRKENKFKWHDAWFIVSVYANTISFSCVS